MKELTEFEPWPKIPRLNKTMIVTEKIDGTNAQIAIRLDDGESDHHPHELPVNGGYIVAAGSRKRWVTPESDNFGFARWVFDNAEDLVALLGEGRHYGEWWGQGIQRGYGLDHRRFSLFNARRWATVEWADMTDLPIDCVPILFHTDNPAQAWANVEALSGSGSVAARCYGGDGPMEGVVVFHVDSQQPFKVIFDGDTISTIPKGLAA